MKTKIQLFSMLALLFISMCAAYGFKSPEKTKIAHTQLRAAVDQCSFCSGSGKCQSCSGSGKQWCSACTGTGNSPYFDRTTKQQIPCAVCHGTGQATCIICAGAGTCLMCHGSGQKP